VDKDLLKIFPSGAGAPDDDLIDRDIEQAALRALNRMGGQKSGGERGGERPRTTEPLRLSPRSQQDASTMATRKRRFVRDGDIPVEHTPFPRAPARAAVHPSGDTSSIAAGKALEVERRARVEAERHAHELETSVRSLETRLGHAEVLVSELKQALATRDMELADRTVELGNERALVKQAHDEVRQLRQQLRERASRKTAVSATEDVATDENGQKPIKWWKD
jgi:uncharacterized coiled-coil protein SlyX